MCKESVKIVELFNKYGKDGFGVSVSISGMSMV